MTDGIENYFTIIPRLNEARDESDILGKKYYKVTEGFTFIMQFPKYTHSVTVHKGFLTNGSSLPFIVRSLIDRWIGLDHPSVILHDWLSEYLLIEANYKVIQINNYDAFDIFIRALKTTKLSKAQISIIYALCGFRNLLKFPFSTRSNPFKRYIEDQNFSRCD